MEREERDGGRQKEVSPLIKIGIFYFGDEVSKLVTEQVVGKTLINCTYFAVVSSKRFASF